MYIAGEWFLKLLKQIYLGENQAVKHAICKTASCSFKNAFVSLNGNQEKGPVKLFIFGSLNIISIKIE